MIKYLKEFVIGSSIFTYFFFLVGAQYYTNERNYSYEKYSLIVPIWFGLFNVISKIYSNYFGLSNAERFISILIITYLLSVSIINYYESYNFKINRRKVYYYIMLLLAYIIAWIVIYLIENCI